METVKVSCVMRRQKKDEYVSTWAKPYIGFTAYAIQSKATYTAYTATTSLAKSPISTSPK